MRIGIAGARSSIAQEFRQLEFPEGTTFTSNRLCELPTDLDAYLICAGFLRGQALGQMGIEDLATTWFVNFVKPARFCDRLFAVNPSARVCLMGSHSGIAGSFDMAYAGAKAALHLYVETKQLHHPEQMLIALAPTIIEDSGMTERRSDRSQLEARARRTRHGRWLKAREVAEMAHKALIGGSPFLSNTVIRMAG